MKIFVFAFVFYFPILGVISEPEAPCTTPNGEKALCQQLFTCDILLQSLASKDPTLKNFFEASKCGDFMVCCGTSANYTELSMRIDSTNATTEESHKDYVIKHLLPTTIYCGMQHTDDYFYNKMEVSVDEFPWVLLVHYDNPLENLKCIPDPFSVLAGVPLNSARPRRSSDWCTGIEVSYRCTGILISNRYALTSSSCASKESMWVALGQHEDRKNISCSDTEYGDYCTEPVLNINITEQIPYPGGNFLLLRLATSLTYSDFVRPICLPMEETIRAKPSDQVTTIGFGYDIDNGTVTVIRKRTIYNLVDNNHCSGDNSWSNYICVKSQTNETSVCGHGLIMHRYKTKNWYIEGIFNADHCVKGVVPGERITPEVVNWILDNMMD